MCVNSFNVWLISGLTVAKQFALCQHQIHYIITLMSSSSFLVFTSNPYIITLMSSSSFLVFTSNHYIITLMSSSQFPSFHIKYITLLIKCRFFSFLVFTSNTLHCPFNVVFTVSWFSHQIITLLL